jgi:GTPase Era involved in 16S rRNA processing
MIDSHLATLEAAGHIETELDEIGRLEKRLQEVPLWQPAAGLLRQIGEARRIIGDMRSRLDRVPVVTIVGPSGAGKSTLLNALAGVDDLSPTGIDRPTTRQPVILCGDEAIARRWLGDLAQQGIPIRTAPAAERLEHLLLVDTPDTDSKLSETHLPIIFEIIEHCDVLICLFDAQNPKRRDHADVMAPLVARFHGASLVAVLNKCDRLDAAELTGEILPDFKNYLRDAWPTMPALVMPLSARRHLRQPAWDSQASPRHEIDGYPQLQELIRETFRRPGFAEDRRVANARNIAQYIRRRVREAIEADREALLAADVKMSAAEQSSLRKAVTAIGLEGQRSSIGVQVRLYQSLAQRWMGPVGWLVAIWSRVILYGCGMMAMLRRGNPVSQMWGALSSWRRYRQNRSALADLVDGGWSEVALMQIRREMLVQWPEIAELVVRARFDPHIRQMPHDDNRTAAQTLDALWAEALDYEIERRAVILSRISLQIFCNLPIMLLMGYAGWLTVIGFINARYLSADFFLHAAVTLLLILALSFFGLQLLVRMAIRGGRVHRQAICRVEEALATRQALTASELHRQIRCVLALH